LNKPSADTERKPSHCKRSFLWKNYTKYKRTAPYPTPYL
jgi:hypothetical protein